MIDWIASAIAATSLVATIIIAKTAHEKTNESNRIAARSADEAQRSADAANTSARAAEEALRLQREQWEYERSASLCIDAIEKLDFNSGSSDVQEPRGFTLSLRNRGIAEAVDLSHQLTIVEVQGTFSLMRENLSRVGPGESIDVHVSFPLLEYWHHNRYEFEVTYRDSKQHNAIFSLRKHQKHDGIPWIESATIDGLPHSAHPKMANLS